MYGATTKEIVDTRGNAVGLGIDRSALDRPPSPGQEAAMDLGNAIDQASKELSALEQRLADVLRPADAPAPLNHDKELVKAGSSVTESLRSFDRQMREITQRITRINQRIDV